MRVSTYYRKTGRPSTEKNVDSDCPRSGVLGLTHNHRQVTSTLSRRRLRLILMIVLSTAKFSERFQNK